MNRTGACYSLHEMDCFVDGKSLLKLRAFNLLAGGQCVEVPSKDCLLRLWTNRRARRVSLCREQACRRRVTKSAALEGAPFGIRVNIVAPSPIETEMLSRFAGGSDDRKAAFTAGVPLKRLGRPEEIT